MIGPLDQPGQVAPKKPFRDLAFIFDETPVNTASSDVVPDEVDDDFDFFGEEVEVEVEVKEIVQESVSQAAGSGQVDQLQSQVEETSDDDNGHSDFVAGQGSLPQTPVAAVNVNQFDEVAQNDISSYTSSIGEFKQMAYAVADDDDMFEFESDGLSGSWLDEDQDDDVRFAPEEDDEEAVPGQAASDENEVEVVAVAPKHDNVEDEVVPGQAELHENEDDIVVNETAMDFAENEAALDEYDVEVLVKETAMDVDENEILANDAGLVEDGVEVASEEAAMDGFEDDIAMDTADGIEVEVVSDEIPVNLNFDNLQGNSLDSQLAFQISGNKSGSELAELPVQDFGAFKNQNQEFAALFPGLPEDVASAIDRFFNGQDLKEFPVEMQTIIEAIVHNLPGESVDSQIPVPTAQNVLATPQCLQASSDPQPTVENLAGNHVEVQQLVRPTVVVDDIQNDFIDNTESDASESVQDETQELFHNESAAIQVDTDTGGAVVGGSVSDDDEALMNSKRKFCDNCQYYFEEDVQLKIRCQESQSSVNELMHALNANQRTPEANHKLMNDMLDSIIKLSDKIATLEDRNEVLEGGSSQWDAALEERDRLIESQHERITELVDEVSTKKANIEQLQQTNAELVSKNLKDKEETEKVFNDHKEELSKLVAELAIKDEAIKKLESTNAELIAKSKTTAPPSLILPSQPHAPQLSQPGPFVGNFFAGLPPPPPPFSLRPFGLLSSTTSNQSTTTSNQIAEKAPIVYEFPTVCKAHKQAPVVSQKVAAPSVSPSTELQEKVASLTRQLKESQRHHKNAIAEARTFESAFEIAKHLNQVRQQEKYSIELKKLKLDGELAAVKEEADGLRLRVSGLEEKLEESQQALKEQLETAQKETGALRLKISELEERIRFADEVLAHAPKLKELSELLPEDLRTDLLVKPISPESVTPRRITTTITPTSTSHSVSKIPVSSPFPPHETVCATLNSSTSKSDIATSSPQPPLCPAPVHDEHTIAEAEPVYNNSTEVFNHTSGEDAYDAKNTRFMTRIERYKKLKWCLIRLSEGKSLMGWNFEVLKRVQEAAGGEVPQGQIGSVKTHATSAGAGGVKSGMKSARVGASKGGKTANGAVNVCGNVSQAQAGCKKAGATGGSGGVKSDDKSVGVGGTNAGAKGGKTVGPKNVGAGGGGVKTVSKGGKSEMVNGGGRAVGPKKGSEGKMLWRP
ncbi:hypothetical protein HDU76_010331 [Blyttiomyces sp. JEL0837]|nr:hypothetical protein HDU76_010331 [Blyttiomyces sp. JEL0837]